MPTDYLTRKETGRGSLNTKETANNAILGLKDYIVQSKKKRHQQLEMSKAFWRIQTHWEESKNK